MGFVLLHPPASLFHHKVDEKSQRCLFSVIVFSTSNANITNAKEKGRTEKKDL